ncbi:MAG: DUF262 domain-containing protein [bacterium]
MIDVQKPDHKSLNSIIGMLREGRFVIPDFQRDFEWKPWDIKELIKSIFLDYYIGSLLLWKGKKENFDALSCETIYGFGNVHGVSPWTKENSDPMFIVLDGQQRLTALYYAIIVPNVPLPNRKSKAVYFIKVDKFMNEQYDDAFQYDWLSKRYERILADLEMQFEEHFFPLAIIGKEGWDLPNWMQGYEQYWNKKLAEATRAEDADSIKKYQQHVKDAKYFSEHIKGITQDYQIAYIELDVELAVDKVCDIFTQINSKGIRLDVFDLINALLKPKGLQLKLMWRDVAPRLNFVETERMNVYVLQVMSILCQAYCSPKYLYYLLPGQEKQIREADGTRKKEILIKNVSEFERKWSSSVDTIEKAIKLLQHPQEYGVTSSQYLPYVSILPAFAAIQHALSEVPAVKRLEAQRKFRQWYWASVFTNRYSGSVESTSTRDYLDMKAWFNSDDEILAVIAEFRSRFRELDLLKETKKGSSIYNGIFNLFVINGARDWISGNIPQNSEIDDHHIVPESWGKKNLKNNKCHTILNRSPLTSDTNRNLIKHRLPNEYLPELIKQNGEKEVKNILATHFIYDKCFDILMRDPFTESDFDEFIGVRQKNIKDAIEGLLIKQRLDLSPKLRDLDKDIEDIELKIRDLIKNRLNDDITLLPQHLKQKADEKIARAAKKNPTFDSEQYKQLGYLLEYSDLQETKDVITAKSLWSKFEEIFNNKEALIQKYNQLSELRNCIRHSRSADDIVRKEGEASILWFKKALKIS